MVALGVFGETGLGIFIATSAKRAERESNERIAELNNETARLRKENNDTELLLNPRSIGDAAAFEQAMAKLREQNTSLNSMQWGVTYPPHDNQVRLHWPLFTSLQNAGWIAARQPQRVNTLSFGVHVNVVTELSEQLSWAIGSKARHSTC